MSLGMIVTRLAWMAHKLVSGVEETANRSKRRKNEQLEQNTRGKGRSAERKAEQRLTLEQADQVRLRSLLQGQDGRSLEAPV